MEGTLPVLGESREVTPRAHPYAHCPVSPLNEKEHRRKQTVFFHTVMPLRPQAMLAHLKRSQSTSPENERRKLTKLSRR